MSTSPSILILDDDSDVVSLLVDELTDHGYQARGMTSALAVLEAYEQGRFADIIISDVEMPELRGLDVMQRLQLIKPSQLVILITAFGNMDLAAQAIREGAADFLAKPFTLEQLLSVIDRVWRERQFRKEIVRVPSQESAGGSSADALDPLVATSRSDIMRRLIDTARRAARFDSNILITGESGVGKSLLAQFIHDHSPRNRGRFVQINAAALPEQLVESELFGVRRGAFTDAREDRPGLLREAQGGTFFLDEIADLPLSIQPKLLLALESRRIRSVGASQESSIDVRFICATHQSLEDNVHDGTFRSDLFYRINIIRLDIPPLRERPEDLEPLIDFFTTSACKRLARPTLGMSAAATRWLMGHSWPGNVRELANTIERAVAMAEHDAITLEDLAPGRPDVLDEDSFLRQLAMRGVSLDELTRRYIDAALLSAQGNKSEAARILGIDRRTLYRRLDEDSDV